jgi:two-component system, OmpR family, sensor histidine kinase SenX3
MGPADLAVLAKVAGLPPAAAYAAAAVILVVAVLVAALVGRRAGRRALSQRLIALGTRLGIDPPHDDSGIETALAYLEQVTGAATQAVAESSSDAIRLRRSLDTLPQGVVLCDENGAAIYRNARANALMTSRHGDALAAQAVTELLEDAWHDGTAERTVDLYGPPRRTLTVRAKVIDDGRRPLGVIAIIEDVSERRRLEEIRRDFVANVSHELKTPMGALGLLAETLISEPDVDVAQRLASRIHTEAFRVSRIIDDLLDLSRIESEEAPPREPVLVNLVMAEAVERVRATADQRGMTIALVEPDPPVAVLGDRRQLVSAMHALLENAVTYSYDNSKVTVSGRVARGEPSGDEKPDGPTGPATLTTTASGSTAPMPAAGAAQPDAAEGDAGPFDAELTAGGEEPEERRTAEPAPHPARDSVRLSVTDHGIGIPARDLDRIFERFYRVDHGRSRDTGGTGLGLSIVRHVANNHQGWVDVESREGEGSTFTLVLPVHAEHHT